MALMATLAVLAAPALAQNRSFTSQFTFGDSLSDNGNLLAATTTLGVPNPPPPYFQGRFSSGRVFTELLGNTIAPAVTAPATAKTNLNFAFGGATAQGSGTLLAPDELRRIIHPHVHADPRRLGGVSLERVTTHEQHVGERLGVVAER